jgi:4-amino-4-deoxy-L-arabinose transferase-like glycosyltransferase
LPTWIAAVVEIINPHDLSTQRSMAGLMAVMWTIFLYATANYISRRRDYAQVTCIIFITCYNVILMGRSATWDIYCHAFMMGGIYFLMRMLYDDRYYAEPHKWRWAVLAGIMMGLSWMSKGPVSFYALLLPFLIATIYTVRPSMRGKWGPLALMIAIVLVLSSWWYIAIWLTHPEAISYVIHKETQAWVHHNERPWYYYWRFFAEAGCWGLLILAALAIPYWRKKVAMSKQYVGTVVSVIACLVLLSLMPEKKMRYLLPLMAFISLAVAHLIIYYNDRHAWAKGAYWLYVVNGAMLTLVILAMPVIVHFFVYKRGIVDHGTALVIDVLFICMAFWMVRNIILRHVMNIVNCIATLFLIAECFLIGTIGETLGNPDRHSIHQTCKLEVVKNMKFFHPESEDLRIEMVYQANRKILPVNVTNIDSLKKVMPCVLVTQKSLKEDIPASVLSQLDTLKVDQCDDNIHPRSDKHYNAQFLNQVSIVKLKKVTSK